MIWIPVDYRGSAFLIRIIREIAEYCESDVMNTYRVWLRYELFRGPFQASDRNLIALI